MTTVISGGIFDFTDDSYLPPSWEGEEYFFGRGSYQVRQVIMDGLYVYAATSDGLDIYDLDSESRYAYTSYSGGFKTVWSSTDTVYLGTTNSGIKYLDKTTISGSVIAPYDLSTHLGDFKKEPNITSNNIKYIHGNDDQLLCCTDAGVDYYKLGSQGFRSYTELAGADKCFMSTQSAYYTVSGTETWELNRVDVMLCDWEEPSHAYVTGSGILEQGIGINDIYATSNNLFVSTTSGVYIIDESTLGSTTYFYYPNYTSSNNFTSLWVDVDASLTYGRMYIGTNKEIIIVDLSSNSVIDRYTKDWGGVAEEVLDKEDMIDITIGT